MISHPDKDNDPALVQLTAEGDAAAFTELYDRHSTLVFSIAVKILEDREDASDVLQQVFLRLLKSAALYRPDRGKPAAWLAAITRNQCLDRLRQRRCRRDMHQKFYLEVHPVAESPRTDRGGTWNSDEVALLHTAISALRPDEIEVLHLAYFGGLSQTEISHQLAQPLGSVKARIRRSLVKLRTSLDGIVERHCPPTQSTVANRLPMAV